MHEPPLLIPGATLADARFVILRTLGTGGMGVVYKARDVVRDTDVALKILSKVEPAGIYRLKQEFRSLSNILHRNLVELRELFLDGGSWFFTMECVEGRPISRLTWGPELVRDVFGQLAEGIHAIHEVGKLHRDLKPSHVMLTPSGRVVILDFGLVSEQVLGGAGQTVVDGGVTGTPAYMAPEQADAAATRASDWYAFGTMLYEALFSAPPFSESGMQALLRKREAPAPRPARATQVPADLTSLCMDLLKRDARRRPGYDRIAAVMGKRTPGQPPAAKAEVFVGRDDELGALWRALEHTDQGRNAAVLVSGAPGIGKTTLVEHFLWSMRKRLGGVVLRGQCRQQEHVPFKACDSLVDDLSRYLRKLETERAAYLLPRNAQALAQVFPVFGRLSMVSAVKSRHGLPSQPAELKRVGLTALGELISNVAAQERLVVFVDDLHWSDVEGARLLASLVSQPSAPALLLVGCHRPIGSKPALGLQALLERLSPSDDLMVKKLSLRGLSENESHQLAAGLYNGSLSQGRFEAEAEGNPLFIRLIVRHAMESDQPPGKLDLDGVIQATVGTLQAQEREALEAISLAHGPISLGLLAQVTGHSDQAHVMLHLEVRRLAHMVSGASKHVELLHDRIRQAVRSSMTDERMRELHARYVDVLAGHPNEHLAELTLHMIGCGRGQEASALAVRAATEAEAALAFEQAAGMYSVALAWGSRDRAREVDLLVRLAENLAADRRSAEGAEAYARAAALEADPFRSRALELRASESFFAGGRVQQAVELLKKVMTELGLDYEAICALDTRELREQLATRGLELTQRPEAEIDPHALQRLEALEVAGSGLASVRSERLQFRFVLALEALDLGSAFYSAIGLSTVASLEAQRAPGDTKVRRAVEALCAQCPGEQVAWVQACMDMSTAFVEGKPWVQRSAARRAEELLLQRPRLNPGELGHARHNQAVSMLALGQLRALNDRELPWLEEAEDRHDDFLCAWLNIMLSHYELAADRPDRAKARCDRVRRICAATHGGASIVKWSCLAAVRLAEAYEGRTMSQTALREIDASAGFPPLLCFQGLVHSYRAILSLLSGEEGAAEESTEVLAQRQEGAYVLPHYRAMSVLFTAGLAARRGQRQAAAALLDRALKPLPLDAYGLYAAYVRRRRALLLGGRGADGEVASAEADLLRRGVVNPARHERIVLRGFSA